MVNIFNAFSKKLYQDVFAKKKPTVKPWAMLAKSVYLGSSTWEAAPLATTPYPLEMLL